MTTTKLSITARKLSDLANENIGLLEGRCQTKIEIQDYYLGVLRRHAIILSDLSTILKDRAPEYISTPYILLRSLIDDFLHLLYLELHDNRKDEITRINSDTYKQSFKSLKDLTDSKYEHFKGMYPFYLTNEQLENVKDIFKTKSENKKYFEKIDTFKFLPFKTFSDMVKCIPDVNVFRDRAYYLWKFFSSFVHYSNFAFEYELKNAPENLYMINDALQYCYNSIYLSFKYFERTFNLTFKDDNSLNTMYGIILSC